VLGGLSLINDQNTISGIPGVTNIPVLGYLFGTKTKAHENDDILIALTPHIVRAPDLSVIGQTGVAAGTERVIRVKRTPENRSTGSTSAPISPSSPGPFTAAPPLTPKAGSQASPVPQQSPANTPPRQPNR
jgi:general secretion pathway protein D